MKTAQIKDPTPDTLREAADLLRAGEAIICPSDANYGLAVDPFNRRAVERCFEIKKRSGNKPLTLFIADPKAWKLYGEAENAALVDALADLYWPGPLNIVVTKRPDAPDLSLEPTETIAIACHANPVIHDLIRTFGGPIAMTSANLSGTFADALVGLEAALEHLGSDVKLALRGGKITTTKSTTIVRVGADMTLLREGDLSFERIQREVMQRLSAGNGQSMDTEKDL
ncbi:MAG: threonylcarbamoyl-AMP synthase [Hydrogenibacillus schlegelii]|uniref:L-threonylcarbamoyladenylate synthase n=1 Tax=Hydrogenibacillus schlegelii TaxID=1484 RepID=A0A947D428_HYDSH|nr:threonylcarbamoyl-AMP synthase [Hydrogenibacillus schlegelii]